MPDVAILVPVLRRPGHVAPLITSAKLTVSNPRLIFVADEDDAVELAALEVERAEVVLAPPGTCYAAKINLAYQRSDEDFFLTGADDLRFHPMWFERARDAMAPGISVVGTNDLCNWRVMRGLHSTHSLVRRSYIEEQGGVIDEPPGKVLHEGYFHEYCDDEFVETARSRGAFVHCHESIVEHLHPLVNKAEDDPVYQRGRERSIDSRNVYRSRRHLWSS